MAEATYYKTTSPTGTDLFHCLYCAHAGQEHSATDPALFASHMEQRHDGRLIEGQAPAPPAAASPATEPPAAEPPAADPPSPPPAEGGVAL